MQSKKPNFYDLSMRCPALPVDTWLLAATTVNDSIGVVLSREVDSVPYLGIADVLHSMYRYE